ncbi:MAG: DegT/DnrJ/EryC1/StrS family aminotransferase [Deltaproteobacteria bacterium]|nr:DegT/DnrJ/EryC1/StrS family aminotransferase [Deltaproteobacteria bacterium]
MPGHELIGKEEKQEVMDILETGIFMRYGFDKERRGVYKVQEFEKAVAAFLGVRHTLGVSSGSAALKVALIALGIEPGDEIIVPAFTFIATYEAVIEAGAIPVWADIDDSLNLDPEEIGRKITARTKAVIPVHMCGAPARIDRIMELAREHNLLVLEDNAQSIGGGLNGKKLGTFGDMGILSFDYYKTITTGEGGMVLTNDTDLYNRADWYHDHGHMHDPSVSRAQENRILLGFNFRMNEFQGAVGLAQIGKLDFIISEQRKNKSAVKEMLGDVEGVGFRHIPDPAGDTATFLAFNLPTAEQTARFQKTLSENGLDTVLFKENKWHYAPRWDHLLARATGDSKQFPYTNPLYTGSVTYRIEDIPFAEDIMGRTLFMGVPVKMSGDRLNTIKQAIRKAVSVL